MLRNTTWAGIGIWSASNTGVLGAPKSPNEKLNIAGIGVGGQGGWDLGNCGGENVVAVCDVDDRRAVGSFERFPDAKRYRDFRKMLGEMDRQIDAVVVGTPDHTHAPPAVMAMKMGKHCYDSDGRYKHYTVGHRTGSAASTTIQMTDGMVHVQEREVLNHWEAIELFKYFFAGDEIPVDYVLRTKDI
jgi:hypothetical protein